MTLDQSGSVDASRTGKQEKEGSLTLLLEPGEPWGRSGRVPAGRPLSLLPEASLPHGTGA